MEENSVPAKERQSKEPIEMSKLIKMVWAHKSFIFSATLAVTALTVVLVFFILDPIYQSTGTIKTTSKSSGLTGMIGGTGSIPGIGDLGDLTGSSSSAKELTLFENILTSRNNIEQVLTKFKLNDEWKFNFTQEAVKNFRDEIMVISKDKIAGTMDISVYDKNPQRSKEIIDFLIEQLNKIYADLYVQNAKNNRQFIESRVSIIKDDLKKAEDSLKIYQQDYGVAPDVIAKYATTAELQLETEIKQEEIKLDLLRKILTPDQSDIRIQEDKIVLLKNQLSEIKNSPDNKSNLRLKNTPDIIMNYFRLSRNLEIQNKLLIYIVPLFEQAKIDENKDTPTVLVLDPPFVPEKKVKPKRMTLIIMSLFGTFFMLSFLTIFYETYIKNLIKKLKED